MKRLVAIAASITVAAAGLAAVPAATASPGTAGSTRQGGREHAVVHPAAAELVAVPERHAEGHRRRVLDPGGPARLRPAEGHEDLAGGLAGAAHAPRRQLPGRHARQPRRPRRLGPGAVGARHGAIVPGNAGDAYDWIGFDPRGVGSSVPALSCDGEYFGYDRPQLRADHRGSRPPGCDQSQGYADGVHDSRRPRLLDHVKTTDTVNDMESLRKALGAAADQLLRLLLRHLPRPGLRDAAPRPGAPLRPRRQRRPARRLVPAPTSTRTAPSRRPSRSTSAGWPSTTTSTTSGTTARGDRTLLLPSCRQLDAHPADGGRRRRTSSPTCSLGAATTSTAGRTSARAYSRVRQRRRRPASRRCTTTPTRRRRQRQRLRDVPRHPVHRRPVAAELEQAGRATTGGPSPRLRS